MSKEKFAEHLAKDEPRQMLRLKTPVNTALWAKAKAAADSQGFTNHWSYIISLYKSYGGQVL